MLTSALMLAPVSATPTVGADTRLTATLFTDIPATTQATGMVFLRILLVLHTTLPLLPMLAAAVATAVMVATAGLEVPQARRAVLAVLVPPALPVHQANPTAVMGAMVAMEATVAMEAMAEAAVTAERAAATPATPDLNDSVRPRLQLAFQLRPNDSISAYASCNSFASNHAARHVTNSRLLPISDVLSNSQLIAIFQFV